jgi:hypothetical protein
VEPFSDIDAWLRWAEQRADAIDPLVGEKNCLRMQSQLSLILGGHLRDPAEEKEMTNSNGV